MPTLSIPFARPTVSRHFTAAAISRPWRSATQIAWQRVVRWIMADSTPSAGPVAHGRKMSLTDARPKAVRCACGEFGRTPRKHVAHRREGIRPCIGEWRPRSLLVSDRRPLKSRSRRRDLNAAFMGGALCLQKWSKPCLLQCVERAVGSGFESIQHISGVKLFRRARSCVAKA